MYGGYFAVYPFQPCSDELSAVSWALPIWLEDEPAWKQLGLRSVW